MTTTAPESVRALESDTVVRDGTLSACIAFMLIRHGALQSASKDNPHRHLYREARDSAEREIKWRFAQHEETWTALLREVAKLATALGDPDNWHEAEDSTLNEEFDPWDVLREAIARVNDRAEPDGDAT